MDTPDPQALDSFFDDGFDGDPEPESAGDLAYLFPAFLQPDAGNEE